jgi:hypothetical protein
LEVLAWDRDVGGSGLGQRRWRFWLGTETLEVLAWDRDVGGSGMGQRHWRFWLGTETLEVLAWDRDKQSCRVKPLMGSQLSPLDNWIFKFFLLSKI